MKVRTPFLVALAVTLLGSIALALAPTSTVGVQITPATGSPCASGTACVWVKSTDSNKLYYCNPANTCAAIATGSSGTVTSVAMTVPSILSVAGSPVTTSGTLAVTLATETANTVLAGATSGGAATPTFRALVAGDIPSLSSVYLPLAGGTLTGNLHLAAAVDLIADGNGSDLDLHLSNGTLQTGTGAISLNGNAQLAGGKSITYSAGVGAFDASLGTGIFKTPTGNHTFGSGTWSVPNATTISAGGAGAVVIGQSGSSLSAGPGGAGGGVEVIADGNGVTLAITPPDTSTSSWIFTDKHMLMPDGAGDSACAAGVGCLRYNNTTHTLQSSLNGAAYADVGGGSTGNWTFSGNNADLSGAAAMGIGLSTATSVKIGNGGVTVAPNGFSDPSIASTATAASRISFGNNIYINSNGTSFNPEDDFGVTLGSSSRRFAEANARHFSSGQAAQPSSAPGTGAGTGGTCTVLAHGTDTSGILEIVSGTAPAGSDAVICTTTLNTAFSNKPHCVISGANSADALLMITTAIYFNYAAGSSTTWVIKNASVGGISGTLDLVYTCTDSSAS